MKYLIIVLLILASSCSDARKLLIFNESSGVRPILHYSIGPEYSRAAFVRYEGYEEDAYIISLKNGDSVGTDTVSMLPLPAVVFWQRWDFDDGKYVIDTMFFNPENKEFFFGWGY